MTPRRLDAAVIQQRLSEIQLLLGDLVEVGEVNAERLRRDRPTRHVVERVLSQIVELAGSINTHIVASLLGRSSASYADSFDEIARAGSSNGVSPPRCARPPACATFSFRPKCIELCRCVWGLVASMQNCFLGSWRCVLRECYKPVESSGVGLLRADMVGDGRSWWVRGLAGMVVLGGLAGCLSGPVGGGQDGPVRHVRSAEQRAALERKIGQMVLVGFRGMSVDAAGPVVEQIRAGQVGGVVLFDVDVLSGEPVRNIRSAEQVRALVDGLQQAAGGALLVAVDQEGGRVTRLKEQYGFPPTVSQRELAQRGVTATRGQAAETARTLSQLGINVNLAPVVDLDVNPASPAIGALGRSFSADAQVVSEHSRAVIESHHGRGVRTAIKHFPGHGSAAADSHRGFVDVSATWSEAELDPYRALIRDGMVDMVMTAHVFNRNLDPEWPATLSPSTINELLRHRLGFSGVVVADDMQMGAIAEHYGLDTALRQAIVAGVDIITFANNNPRAYEPDIAPRAINIIAALVADGTISEARIDESVGRIRALKQRLSR